MRIGLIGIVRQELEQDFWGTLEKVAAIGYEGIEVGAGSAEKQGLSPEQFRRRLEGLGLQAIALHTQKYRWRKLERAILDEAQGLGCEAVAVSWGPVETLEQLKQDANLYTWAGLACRDRGLQLVYHNHDHEFQTVEEQLAFDVLMSESDPQAVHALLDVAWVRFGGQDPAAIIRRYSGRVDILHAKDILDLPAGCESGQGDRKACRFTEVGTGIVDLPAVVAAAKAAGVRWATVEQDRPHELPPMQSIQVSYANLRKAIDATR